MAGRTLKSLAERKADLVSRCEAERTVFLGEVDDFRHRTRWIDAGWRFGVAVAPKLRLLAPVAGLLLARNLPQSTRLLGRVGAIWQIAQRIVPAIAGVRASLSR
jgi:hypothetical protein